MSDVFNRAIPGKVAQATDEEIAEQTAATMEQIRRHRERMIHEYLIDVEGKRWCADDCPAESPHWAGEGEDTFAIQTAWIRNTP